MKIVILGSCRFAPYEILLGPNPFDPELYKRDHEAAYKDACKRFFPAIEEADEVWVYAPDGIGEHTASDLGHALQKGKTVLILKPFPYDAYDKKGWAHLPKEKIEL